ncbi:MAG: phosphatidylinositol mannoside acyltransferase [Acidimicrobiales bacterium]
MAEQLRRRLTFAAYRGAAAVARNLPGPVAAEVAAGVAMLFAYARPARRALVASHLRRIAGDGLGGGDLDRAVDRVFRSYGRYWAESFRLHVTPPDELVRAMTTDGLEHLDAALAQGRGAILALPHLGGWDFGGAWLTSIGYPTTVVVEPLEPPELFEWFASLRQGSGLFVVPMGSGAPAALIAALRRNEVVGLVSDRDLGGRGVPVEIFGEQTTLPAGPALLSLRTGAPVLPAAVYAWPSGMHRSVVRPPLPVPGPGHLSRRVAVMTGSLATELEVLIRRAPDQWHLLQPNWPSDLGSRATGQGDIAPLRGSGARGSGARGSGARGTGARGSGARGSGAGGAGVTTPQRTGTPGLSAPATAAEPSGWPDGAGLSGTGPAAG